MGQRSIIAFQLSHVVITSGRRRSMGKVGQLLLDAYRNKDLYLLCGIQTGFMHISVHISRL